MASPVKFFFALLVVCTIGWVAFMFAARLLAWFLSRTMGASVGFRVAGCNCLRDVTLKFKKGAVESVSIGEIKLSLRKSLVKLGYSFISRDPKLQLLISELEIVTRPSEKGKKKGRSQRSHSSGRGKWMILTNVARFLSVSVTELTVKVPKAGFEVKDLRLDISKNDGPNPVLGVKLYIIPFLMQIGDSRLSFDQSSSYSQIDCLSSEQSCSSMMEKNSAPFICEDLSVTCEFGHDREKGIKVRNLDVVCGDVTVNLNENLFTKKASHSETSGGGGNCEGGTFEPSIDKSSQKKKFSVMSMKQQIFAFPEKVSFNMPKLDLKYLHWSQGLYVESNVMGIHLRSSKSQYEESGETTSHFDVQMDFSEIHLLKEGTTSILEVLKVAVVASLDVPMQPVLPIRAEIDVKLGGAQCNLIMGRLKPWLQLQKSKKKRMILREQNCRQEENHTSEVKAIMWTFTVSAPEMTLVLYNLDGVPLYHGCSQSSHLFSNNIASKGIQVHTELGELHLHMADEYQEFLKENLFGVEANSSSLMHIARVSLDWGHKELETHEGHDPNRWKLVLSVDISGMDINFKLRHVEALILAMMAFRTLLKTSSSGTRAAEKKVTRSNKVAVKGTRIVKLNLEKCSINYCGDLSQDDAVVSDPKHVNYGSQGGRVIISVNADGTPRTASISSSLRSGCKHMKFFMSLDIFHLSVSVNKDKESTQMELDRARSVYEEQCEEQIPCLKVTLFDMRNAKFVRRSGGLNDIAVCSLFSATDITVRWEPDAHLALFEFITSLKFMVHNQKLKGSCTEIKEETINLRDTEQEKESIIDELQTDKQVKKRESVFAVDVEMLNISAELADGVEAVVHVQSIFSENAKIGVLLEGLMLSFNGARIFKSSRMQVSRIPVSSSDPVDSKVQSTTWDWVIQGLDIHICMAYRLQLRAIDDAVEDTLRGLKLITAAKTSLLFPVKKDNSKKSPSKSSKFGSLRFIIRKLTADIEEEPIQGWLDEHYHLLKTEICEQDIRLKFLDEIVSASNNNSGNAETSEVLSGQKLNFNGIEIDVHNPSAIQRLREEIHKQTFRSYYEACQKMAISEGSGACKTGFQAGFKPSTNRTSLLSICASDLDVTLTKIKGGDVGMVDFIRNVDPVARQNEIPFSRLYGSNIVLSAGTLAAQLRNYTFPLFSATGGKCQGCVVLAQQATSFQPQMVQDVYVGRWRTVRMLRSLSGTTPPVKTYSDLPIYFQKGEVSFGVGYEPAFADISYAFTVALRRANLSIRHPDGANNPVSQPPKRERSLPWWDDMRNYIHGKNCLSFCESTWNLLATTNPYEKLDKLRIISGHMDIQQTDGRVILSAKDLKAYITSLESLTKNCSLKLPRNLSGPFLDLPGFSLEVVMDWDCDSGTPLNHYLFALPSEGVPREKVFDPFRSTSLSLRWNFSLRPSVPSAHNSQSAIEDNATLDGTIYGSSQKMDNSLTDCPTMNFGAHDLSWAFKWWNMVYNPPHKLRSFSRWPRFGVPRIARSGNLSLDRVMTENFLRVDSTPTCMRYLPLGDDDPASGLIFNMTKLKFELCYSRGKQRYTFESKRDPLDLVYQGLDMHILKAYLNKDSNKAVQDAKTKRSSQTVTGDKVGNETNRYLSSCTEKHRDAGFLLYSDYFTIRKQAPKADPARLLSWQEAGRKNLEMTYVRSEFENGSESDHTRSDPSDDDGFNVVIADNCQRVFVYGLKLLWTIENRDAVWSWAGGISKAFGPPKPSPSRQYAQRKVIEGQVPEGSEMAPDDAVKSSPPISQNASSSSPNHVDDSGSLQPSFPPAKTDGSSTSAVAKLEQADDSEEEGTRHFMVNVIQPQFNLHSEDANGRFLLAAASGRVLARSFHSVLHVGYEMIEQALGSDSVHSPETQPEMTWKRVELSVMLEHVQAHVAPTDVDPGAGLQWLPKILRSSPKVKRTGALLERVFLPCQMYFRYTRHKGGTAELKVKPLKELTFNSPNITATMTSRQFQVMLDVLSNLLFARLPKPRKNSLSYPSEDDDDIEEEADEVVPDGVEEVELAKIGVEQRERERKLLLDDIRTLLVTNDYSGDQCVVPEMDGDLWMISCGKSILVQGLKKEFGNIQKSRKAASTALRMALQKAAQLRLMEKEKNKSPSYAMRISMRINKVVWSMLADGKTFAEAEINDMFMEVLADCVIKIFQIYDFDRDYKDIGIAQFTTKSFVVRNCLPNAKSDMLLSAWNAPPEWGKKVMLRVDAKQGAPKDGSSPLELFQVEIYPLKIHLAESMYRMMWDYFFPEEEQDSQRRQEVWKVSTTAGSKRGRKGASSSEAAASSSHASREPEALGKLGATNTTAVSAGSNQVSASDLSQALKVQNKKSNFDGSSSELRRTSSFDRTWEENVAESVANELFLQVHSSSILSSKSGPLAPTPEQQNTLNEEGSKNKPKDKALKAGRLSHEEKKAGKSQDDKRARTRKMMDFHNIKISQVELLVTYEGSRFAVSDLRLLMDTFHRVEFTGTWRRLFSRVKKHIIWGVLKSVTGMQGKKFKDKAQGQKEVIRGVPDTSDLNLSDSDGGQPGKPDQYPITWLKRPTDGAGDGFVTSIKGLFNSQRRKAKAFVLRTMRGDPDTEFHGEWSESDVEFSPFARQLTITKAKKLIRRHTKKFRSRGQKGPGLQGRDSVPSSPRETTPYQSDSSGGSSYEEFH